MKVCCRCKVNKERSEFGNKKSEKDGLQYHCKACGKLAAESTKASFKVSRESALKSSDTFKCQECEETKIAPEFYFINTSGVAKPQLNRCKKCVGDRHVEITLGLTATQYQDLLKSQDYACKICGVTEEEYANTGFHTRLSVDHCHDTGKIRGILCGQCNSAIGLLKDNIMSLQKAIEYLS